MLRLPGIIRHRFGEPQSHTALSPLGMTPITPYHHRNPPRVIWCPAFRGSSHTTAAPRPRKSTWVRVLPMPITPHHASKDALASLTPSEVGKLRAKMQGALGETITAAARRIGGKEEDEFAGLDEKAKAFARTSDGGCA
jgi:hypothetical protein